MLLADIDDPAALDEACRRAAQECSWFPSVADIRDRLPEAYVRRKAAEASRMALEAYEAEKAANRPPEPRKKPTGPPIDIEQYIWRPS